MLEIWMFALAALPGYISNYVPRPGASISASFGGHQSLGVSWPAIVDVLGRYAADLFDDPEGGGGKFYPSDIRATAQPLGG